MTIRRVVSKDMFVGCVCFWFCGGRVDWSERRTKGVVVIVLVRAARSLSVEVRCGQVFKRG